ncbi:MAG: hypothetical protein ACRDQU_16820 [Pseudonocardiaceae bacterium]
MNEHTDDTTPWYLWVAIGSPDQPPRRILVESCVTCAALVPVSRFDVHGLWHARTPQPGQQDSWRH